MTKCALDLFPESIQNLPHPMAYLNEKYHLDGICSMRYTGNFYTSLLRLIWQNFAQNMPCVALTIFSHDAHMLLHLHKLITSSTFTWNLSRKSRVIPSIKGSHMGLEQNYFPTSIVKRISAILCNFFRHLYGNSPGSISIWESEGLFMNHPL